MILLKLFLSFLQIGAFSFGGGYAAMPLIQAQVVIKYGWLTMEEFTNLITIAEMTPGPIAVNSATFVGTKIAGVPGALVATMGCILPSCIIVTMIASLYLKYRNLSLMQGILRSLRPAVVAMIASAGISILITAFWGSSAAIALVSVEKTREISRVFSISLRSALPAIYSYSDTPASPRPCRLFSRSKQPGSVPRIMPQSRRRSG